MLQTIWHDAEAILSYRSRAARDFPFSRDKWKVDAILPLP